MNYMKYAKFNGWPILYMIIYTILFIWNASGYYPWITCKIGNSIIYLIMLFLPIAAFLCLMVSLGYQMTYLNYDKLNKDYKLSPQQKRDVETYFSKRSKTTYNLMVAGNVLNITMFWYVLISWLHYFMYGTTQYLTRYNCVK